jgi:glycosyltransferase involved in cell wall biosynthesis
MEPMYTIVIPVYNSANIIEKTCFSVKSEMAAHGLNYEIILINDGSTDNSWEVISEIALKNNNVKSIQLLKNYGQHTALFCGMQHAKGDYIIMMDDDMQNPPSEIEKLIQKINEGYDGVFAKFEKKKHGLMRRLGSRLIGFLNEKIFNKPKSIILSNFRIITREVCDRITGHKTNFPYIPGLILMYGNKFANVTTKHEPRQVGQSTYSISSLLRLTSRLLFGYSSYPMRFLTKTGLLISFFSLIFGIYVIVQNLLGGVPVLGWSTVVVLISFLCGFIIALLGIMGEYIIQILNRVSIGQPYVIKEIKTFGQP